MFPWSFLNWWYGETATRYPGWRGAMMYFVPLYSIVGGLTALLYLIAYS